MKIIIAGSRGFANFRLMVDTMDAVLKPVLERGEPIEIVSGGASGADLLGEYYAIARGYPLRRFPAEWDKYGKAAGFKRNEVMLAYADKVVCFWDRKSRGTQHMITITKEAHKPLRLIRY